MPAEVDPELVIEGKIVTKANAWRFVKRRYPNAKARREWTAGFHRTKYAIVSASDAAWIYATGSDTGTAWLRAARNMVAHDHRAASDRSSLASRRGALLVAVTLPERERAALRYAAERLKQSGMSFSAQSAQETLLAMVGTVDDVNA